MLITDEKWHEYGFPDRLVQEMKIAAEKKKKQMHEREQELLDRHLSQKVSDLRFPDLEQMKETSSKLDKLEVVAENSTTSSNATLNTNSNNNNNNVMVTADSVEDANLIKTRQMKDVINVIADVASRVENDESVLENIKQGLSKISEKQKFGDLELEVQTIFESIIGLNSKTSKVFKAIHQNM